MMARATSISQSAYMLTVFSRAWRRFHICDIKHMLPVALPYVIRSPRLHFQYAENRIYGEPAAHPGFGLGLEGRASVEKVGGPRAFCASRGDQEYWQADRGDRTGRHALPSGLGPHHDVVRADGPPPRPQGAGPGRAPHGARPKTALDP